MKSKPILKGLVYFLVGGLSSLILLGLVAYFSNINLPTGLGAVDRLGSLDKIRLAEALHLKAKLGDLVWPGWGQMDIPVLIWHSENSFLFGIDGPPPGWEVVPGDQFQGSPYYRNATLDPENFAMRIGGQWVASMATKDETDLFIQKVFRDVIPDFLEPFFPFRLLILNSEIQMTGVLHETFHVFQAKSMPEKFARADASYENMDAYWQIDDEMGDAWQKEMNLLIEALEAETTANVGENTRQFLNARDQRRIAYRLTSDLIAYEEYVEWLEGLAKYVELTIWETAVNTSQYHAIPELSADQDFKNFTTFQRRWNQEISQARRQTGNQGDVRFYYSGMLQARLLDRLTPDWKTQVMTNGLFLEDLLRQAVFP